MNLEEKIQALNYAKERLEEAINEIENMKCFKGYYDRWQEDIKEMDAELSELEKELDKQCKAENEELELEYERSAI